jgi:hypothetical protein
MRTCKCGAECPPGHKECDSCRINKRLRTKALIPATDRFWHGRVNFSREELIQMFELGAACSVDIRLSDPLGLVVQDRIIDQAVYPSLSEPALLWQDLILSRLKLSTTYIVPAFFALRECKWRTANYPIAFIRTATIRSARDRFGIGKEKRIKGVKFSTSARRDKERLQAHDEALAQNEALVNPSEISEVGEDPSAQSRDGKNEEIQDGDVQANSTGDGWAIRYDLVTEVYRDGEEASKRGVHRSPIAGSHGDCGDEYEPPIEDADGRRLPGNLPVPLKLTRVVTNGVHEWLEVDHQKLWEEFRKHGMSQDEYNVWMQKRRGWSEKAIVAAARGKANQRKADNAIRQLRRHEGKLREIFEVGKTQAGIVYDHQEPEGNPRTRATGFCNFWPLEPAWIPRPARLVPPISKTM